MAKELFEKSIRKKAKIREILKEVERKISEKSVDSVNSRLNDYSLANQGSREVLIFEGGSDWELILLGVVASILTKEERKPVFLFKKGKIESQGSVRAPAEFNVVEAMKSCSKNLITYGGHPRAAGFGIKNENLKEFKQCLVEYFEKYSAKYENIRNCEKEI